MNNINNLVQVQDNQILVSSRQIAEHFEKEHDKVIRDIENAITNIEGSQPPILEVENMFIKSTYLSDRGRNYKEYLLNRDGFSLLVMGFTGSKALHWKLKYIQAFNEMERILKEQNEKAIQTDLTVAEKAVHTAGILIQFDKDIRQIKNDISKLFYIIKKEPKQIQNEEKEYATSLVNKIAEKYSCRAGIHKMAITKLVSNYCIDSEKFFGQAKSKFDVIMNNQSTSKQYIAILENIAIDHNIAL